MPSFRAAVLTVSEKGARREREDLSGPALASRLQDAGFRVEARAVVPDNEEAIARELIRWADEESLDLIVTTGGTGFSPSDVTPEATLKVLDRETPGLAEAMRLSSLKKTPRAMLSRGRAGIRGATLIVNLPGSLKGALENLDAIIEALPHGLEKLRGDPSDCGG